MSQFKGTPGPWSIPTSQGSSGGIAHAGGYVAFTAIPRKTDETRLDGESWLDMRDRTRVERDAIEREQEDNRRLIAAAPELLEALEAVKQWDGVSGLDDEWPLVMEGVKAAIAKATGEQA
jgi:hypothetical protein